MKLYASKYWMRKSCPGWTNGSKALSNSLARGCLYLLAITFALIPVAAFAQPSTCNGAIELLYLSGNNYAIPGDVYRVEAQLGAGSIANGTTLTVNRLRFELDCQNPGLGIPCTDEGALVSYSGNLDTTACAAGGVFSAVAIGNEVTFTPTTPVAIPADTPPLNGCHIEFDVTIDSTATSPGGNTPNAIDQVVGYNQVERDGECNNTTGPLAAGTQQSAAIPVCPTCGEGDFCTDLACNQSIGVCEPFAVNEGEVCGEDGNLCIPDLCDDSGVCVPNNGTPVVCDPETDFCTDLACTEATGVCDPFPVNIDEVCGEDGNLCIPDLCDDSGVCVPNNGTPVVCDPETDFCTDLACTEATGVCDPFPVNIDEVCGEDGNLCIPDLCDDSGVCVPNNGTPVVCDPETDFCTDLACTEATGVCDPFPVNIDEVCGEDGNLCIPDLCDDSGVCVPNNGTPVVCDPETDFCTDLACTEATGVCDPFPVNIDEVCGEDGNLCIPDLCDDSGVCVPNNGTPVVCDPETDFCTDLACTEATGVCDPFPVNIDEVCGEDGNLCIPDLCDDSGVCVPNNGTPVVCDPETDFCTDLACTEATGVCDPFPVNIDEVCGEDGNLCIPDLCDDSGVCVPNNGTPVVCDPETDFCTDLACTEATGVCDPFPVNIDEVCGEDGNLCIPDLCDDSGVCVPNNGTPVVCDPETDFCTDLACTEATGVCDPFPVNIDEVCGEDGNLCIPDLCDDSGVCVPNNGVPVVCDDEVCEACTEETGLCDAIPEDELPPGDVAICFGEEICRTPGFWGARGGVEKLSQGSKNITQMVIDSAGGSLDVCGGMITNTDLKDSMSAIEAICINDGDPKGKLIRNLTSSALNCALGDCSANTAGLVAYCNDACANGDDFDYGWCSSNLDCFNNGGHINDDGTCVAVGTGVCLGSEGEACLVDDDCVVGSCTMYDSCHDRELCAEDDEACAYDPLGPASSPKKCNQARKDGKYIWEY